VMSPRARAARNAHGRRHTRGMTMKQRREVRGLPPPTRGGESSPEDRRRRERPTTRAGCRTCQRPFPRLLERPLHASAWLVRTGRRWRRLTAKGTELRFQSKKS
jgi:hypothetical protein